MAGGDRNHDRHLALELRRAGRRRRDDPRYRRQDAVFDADALGSVARGLDAVCDDHCHRVADVAYLAPRQQRMLRFLHRRAVLSSDAPGAWHAVQLVGGDVIGGEDRRNAGARQRLGLFDCHNDRGWDRGTLRRREEIGCLKLGVAPLQCRGRVSCWRRAAFSPVYIRACWAEKPMFNDSRI